MSNSFCLLQSVALILTVAILKHVTQAVNSLSMLQSAVLLYSVCILEACNIICLSIVLASYNYLTVVGLFVFKKPIKEYICQYEKACYNQLSCLNVNDFLSLLQSLAIFKANRLPF